MENVLNRAQEMLATFAKNKDEVSIKIFGLGGGGCNAVNHLINLGIKNVECYAVNTDAQSLHKNRSQYKIHIGTTITKGLGSGGNPAVAERAAREDLEQINSSIEGANLVVIVAGLGGGTGSGASPVVAAAAKAQGAQVLSIVYTPFRWEGANRQKIADIALENLKEYTDGYMVVPNDKLNQTMSAGRLVDAFAAADNILCSAVLSITDIITKVGLINRDFRDIESAMLEKGETLIGYGRATGENRAIKALERAVNSPLLENVYLKGCFTVVYSVVAAEDDFRFGEFEEVANKINELTGENTHKSPGVGFDERTDGAIDVIVFATGLAKNRKQGRIISLEDKLREEAEKAKNVVRGKFRGEKAAQGGCEYTEIDHCDERCEQELALWRKREKWVVGNE